MKKLLIGVILAAALAACDSSEERAERHYQTAITLLAEGDEDRALIELRNVFELNGFHREARRLYASTVLAQGNWAEAYGQYRRLVEQYPDDLEANLVLARMSLDNGNFEESRPFIDPLVAADPQDPFVQSMDALSTYLLSDTLPEEAARGSALEKARGLLAQDPTLLYARQVMLAHHLKQRDWNALLDETDAALENAPEMVQLFRLRLIALEQLGDKAGIEATLRTIATNAPEDQSASTMLTQWYIREGALDKAEAWLAAQVTADNPDATNRMRYLDFLIQYRDKQAAMDALDQALGAEPRPADVLADPGRFVALRAGLMFELNEQEDAITSMRALIAASEDEEATNRLKVALAKMLLDLGQEDETYELVHEVLASDPSQIDALQMDALRMIDLDQTGDAILTLRRALDLEPENSGSLTLLARAYEREGSRELALDMLNRAIEASGRAEAETLRAVQFMMEDGQLMSAENVLIEGLNVDNRSVAMLAALGDVHLALEDWPRLKQDIGRLREFATDTATTQADRLETARLIQTGASEELLDFVQNRAADDLGSQIDSVRAMALTGKASEALDRARTLLEEHPDNPTTLFLYGKLLADAGQIADANGTFKLLTEVAPDNVDGWSGLYNSHMAAQDVAAAEETLAAANAALPGNDIIGWMSAAHLENTGQYEAAIDAYRALYEQDSSKIYIANNLAHLLSSYRQDPESLKEAYRLARRLRDLKVPAFQDTYGWIAYQRNDIDDAVAHLRQAAAAMKNDPAVHYHLAMALIAQLSLDEAEEVLQHIEVLQQESGDKTLSEQVVAARAALVKARAELAEAKTQ
ncbi:MAG: tetratricopeptide repeat protein [Pseudomonadota bacterium]|nr:tetratricopeptide repeat protein [Pseudomonadota bacterium]